MRQIFSIGGCVLPLNDSWAAVGCQFSNTTTAGVSSEVKFVSNDYANINTNPK